MTSKIIVDKDAVNSDAILREQLHQLLQGMRNTVPTVFGLIVFVLVIVLNAQNAPLLVAWALLAAGNNWSGYRQFRRLMAVAQFEYPKRVVQSLTLRSVVGGVIWGLLPWATLDSLSTMEILFVLVLLPAVSNGAVSSRSAVLGVCYAYIVPNGILIVAKLGAMGGLTFYSLAATAFIYMLALMVQARSNAAAVLASINLRFENADLLERLRRETSISDTARTEAELANVAKSKFLAAASHDLRQPIHAQGLFLDVLIRTPLDEQQRQLVNGIQAATQASSEMLHSLLDYSRIEAGAISPEISAFRIQPVLNKIEREFFGQADAKGLRYRSRESRLVVQSDPALLELILRNLVANAIRYTSHGGVLLVCRKRAGMAVFEVWDTGAGIAPNHQMEVFREFHQLGNPQRDRRNGLGLGLAIVKALAKVLNHTVTLQSTPDKGSVFRLELPLAQGAAPVSESSLPTLQDAQLFTVRALVVDDDEVVRDSMLHLLRDWGCNCVGASGVEDAVPKALAHNPQIVISDYRLQNHLTGFDVIVAVRAAMGCELPAILITGDTAPDRIREAMATGLPLFHKPISPNGLYGALVAALSAKSA